MVEAVEMMEILYGAVTGEFQVEKEKLAVIGSFVPVLICGIVRELNERERSKGTSVGERVEPRVLGTVGAKTEPRRESGSGLKRAHHYLSGFH